MIGFCLLAGAVSAISNRALPTRSTIVDRLSGLDKARLAEVLHLRQALGEAAWPGWSQADIPIVLYNEEYAFLVGYPNPPPGWRHVPSLEARGWPWEAVPGDLFEGQPYYRTRLTGPGETGAGGAPGTRQDTPQGFTVLIGDRWAASFQTRQFSEVSFAGEIRSQLPPVLSDVVPIRLAWELLMGKTEAYIGALEHESFHAYQGMLAAEQLAAAERSTAVEGEYPFDAMDGPWRQEMRVLVQAARAPDSPGASGLARQFLQMRAARRAGLNASLVAYERLREWEEGLAKYVELEIGRLAGAEESYLPVAGMAHDADFQAYAGQAQFWSAQLDETTRTQGRSGDTRFYYSGNALAVVLDRLLPGWKERALPGGEYLDELLLEAVR
jgi:hypothetical protein